MMLKRSAVIIPGTNLDWLCVGAHGVLVLFVRLVMLWLGDGSVDR